MIKKGLVSWGFRLGPEDELLAADKKEIKMGEVVAKTSKGKLVSPVNGKIIIKGDRVILKFKAVKFCGQGLGGGRSWGSGLKKLSKREELTFEDQGKIIIDETNDAAVRIKAKAIGASGVVMVGDRISSYLPTVGLTESEFQKISEYVDRNCPVWINGESGRIFIVL